VKTPHYFRDGEYPRCELRELPEVRRWYVPDPADANRVLTEVLAEKHGIWADWLYTNGWLIVRP
jgi:hypothetical protein